MNENVKYVHELVQGLRKAKSIEEELLVIAYKSGMMDQKLCSILNDNHWDDLELEELKYLLVGYVYSQNDLEEFDIIMEMDDEVQH